MAYDEDLMLPPSRGLVIPSGQVAQILEQVRGLETRLAEAEQLLSGWMDYWKGPEVYPPLEGTGKFLEDAKPVGTDAGTEEART